MRENSAERLGRNTPIGRSPLFLASQDFSWSEENNVVRKQQNFLPDLPVKEKRKNLIFGQGYKSSSLLF